MTKDDVIRWAREADLIDFRDADDDPHTEQMVEFLERFAALVAANAIAAEREACALVCEKYGTSVTTKDCAAAIRARSNHD